MLFIGHFDGVLVVVIFDVILKAGPTKREGILRRKGGAEDFPQWQRPVIVTTSKSVGVNIPLDN